MIDESETCKKFSANALKIGLCFFNNVYKAKGTNKMPVSSEEE